MGAWSHTSFGNDDAGDFLYEVEASGMDAVTTALEAIEQTPADGYIEAPSAWSALAAAELLAAANGKPPEDFPEEARAVLAQIKSDAALRARAAVAVQRVLAASELKELWEESDSFADWAADVTHLIGRLK
ncbi:MAG: DUF4259 domain-containing protein [Hyphomonadaceae bacterium]